MSNYSSQCSLNVMSSEIINNDTPLQIFKASNSSTTASPLSHIFLNPQNISWIISEIELQLTQFQKQPVRLLVSHELATTIARLMISKQMIAATQENLQDLNQTIIQEEFKVQRLSLSHRQLHYKYFVQNDRFKVMPRARQENEGTKWDQQTEYTVNDPKGKQKSAFDEFVRHA